MSSSTKIDNWKKYFLILGKGATQELEHALSAEKMYSINFTGHNKRFCLSLPYSVANSYLFVNGKEIYKFKAKDSEIVATLLCLYKKNGLIGYVYDFSIDYNAVPTVVITHILMIKNIVKNENV